MIWCDVSLETMMTQSMWQCLSTSPTKDLEKFQVQYPQRSKALLNSTDAQGMRQQKEKVNQVSPLTASMASLNSKR